MSAELVVFLLGALIEQFLGRYVLLLPLRPGLCEMPRFNFQYIATNAFNDIVRGLPDAFQLHALELQRTGALLVLVLLELLLLLVGPLLALGEHVPRVDVAVLDHCGLVFVVVDIVECALLHNLIAVAGVLVARLQSISHT